ncbi:RWD domain-containing protein 2B [Fasciola hepatica]|uniref:RWD domain-containing protein 2B n=1 Tax=Fasciola hepatica TaxID=6192 RepID=A0A4E0S0E4_FASHE|nr:RWD domain-containing protein 2B [Fasciola hepatica]
MIMNPHEAREAELELLRSMYTVGKELIFHNEPCVDVTDLKSLDQEYIFVNRSVYFTLKVCDKAELSVQLPAGYPSGDPRNPVPPVITVRLLSIAPANVNERKVSSRFNEWLVEAASEGEPVICSAIDWVLNELNQPTPTSTAVDASEIRESKVAESVICLWIVSHHIRSPLKRKLIQEWAAELKLGGVSMPGRPGIVVAEGEAQNADEYWRRLRGLQWKHIQLRDREVYGTGSYKELRFADGFQEVFLSHQSRFAWLHNRGITSNQFTLVFGIPGRLPQSVSVD